MEMPRYKISEKHINSLIKTIKSTNGGEKIIKYLLAKNISKGTLRNYLYMLRYYYQVVGEYSFTHENIIKFLSTLKTMKLGDWSKARAKKNLKALLNSLGYKELASIIEYKKPRNKLKRSDLLSHEDIYKLVSMADSTMYKALIMLGYESGARPSELLELKVKDVDIKGNYGYISIPMTKTVSRTFPIFLSVPYITDWLDIHPVRHPDAYLWYSHTGRPLYYDAYRIYLRRLMNKAGIKTEYKKPYILRHTRITEMCRYLPSRIVKKIFGIKDDKTLDYYEHLAMQDVEDSLLGFYGEKPRNSDPYIKCRVCGTVNLPVQKYCAKCQYPLSKEAEIISYPALLEHKDLRDEIKQLRKEFEEYLRFMDMMGKR
jgi:integrase